MLKLGQEGFLRSASTILCLGAHSDDIEIGCGGTILRLLEQRADVHVVWVVLSAEGVREDEARRSADRFLVHANSTAVTVEGFRSASSPIYPNSRNTSTNWGVGSHPTWSSLIGVTMFTRIIGLYPN